MISHQNGRRPDQGYSTLGLGGGLCPSSTGRPPLLVRYVPEQVLVERDFGRVLYSVTKFYYRGLLIALTAMPSLRGLLFARTSVPKLEDYYSEVQLFLCD